MRVKPIVLGLEDAKGDCIQVKSHLRCFRFGIFQKPEDISDGNTDVTLRSRSETIAIGALRALMAANETHRLLLPRNAKIRENGWVARGDEIEIVRFEQLLDEL